MDSQATRESDRLIPSDEEIRTRAIAVLGKRPCQWQINVCKASLRGTQDIISVSATGTGKTLTFWLPLLFRPTGIQIVVTPLNILGQQNVDTLSKAGVKGIFISSKTATRRNFEVCTKPFTLLTAFPDSCCCRILLRSSIVSSL